jgi:hypothetical protein
VGAGAIHHHAILLRVGLGLFAGWRPAPAVAGLLAIACAKGWPFAKGIGSIVIERYWEVRGHVIGSTVTARQSQPKRINKSLREVTAIWKAIQSGDPDLAERCCVDHINAAAVAALDMIERSAAKETAGSGEPTSDAR